MRVAHSFLAILAGFITIVGLMGIATALFKRIAPNLTRDGAPLGSLAMTANVGIGLACSILGGYVTARFARSGLLAHARMLALAVLVFGGLSALQMKGRQPIYYSLIQTVIPPLAVLCGELLRLHQLGLHW